MDQGPSMDRKEIKKLQLIGNLIAHTPNIGKSSYEV